MNKRKVLLFSFIIFILLIEMLPEFSLRVITPVCREAESRGETYETEEIKSNKKDYRFVDFSQDADIPFPTSSIHHLDSFVIVFEPSHISSYLYFPSDLFNHSPPILYSV